MTRLETLSDAALRSAAARWAGLALGVGALAFLAVNLTEAWDEAVAWARSVTAGGVVAFAAGFGAYHLGSVVTLRPLLGRPGALPVWTAAQLIKYLPVPGSAVIGMVGSTVRRGGTTRQGVGLIIRHSLLHVGAATAVGVWVVAPAAERLVGVPPAATATVGVVAGLALAAAMVWHLPPAQAVGAVAVALVTWAVLGGLLAVGFAADGDWLLLAAAYPAGWVAGQLVVPVPAGIGVREVVLLVLLTPALGDGPAAAFALGTRLLHLASDAALIAVSSGRDGWARLRGGGAPGGS